VIYRIQRNSLNTERLKSYEERIRIPIKMSAYYEILGVVDKILVYRTPGLFDLKTQTSKFRCSCPFFKPVQEGDIVLGAVKQSSTPDLLEFVSEPFVQIPSDEGNIKLSILKALGPRFPVEKFYETLIKSCEFEQMRHSIPKWGEKISPQAQKKEITSVEIIVHISSLASQWTKTRNLNVVKALVAGTNFDPHKVSELLFWWNKNRNLRSLYLLGLNNSEIKKCNKSTQEIYDICVGIGEKKPNPFRLPAISMEKCNKILQMRRMTPHEDDIACGEIVRKIYQFSEEKAWTFTPFELSIKCFLFPSKLIGTSLLMNMRWLSMKHQYILNINVMLKWI
jgi:hypothetical protein